MGVVISAFQQVVYDIIQLCTSITSFRSVCGFISGQVLNDRMTEIRNENEDLRSAAVIADEAYQKVLAERGVLERDLLQANDDNSRLLQQVRCCCCCCCVSVCDINAGIMNTAGMC